MLALALAACHAAPAREAAMATVAVHELYSGGGAVAGRSERLLIVRSAAAWQRIAPSLQGQREDWASLPIDWKRSVALVVQAPPAGDAAHLFHVAEVTRSAREVVVRVELRAIPGREPGPWGPTTWSAVPVLNPSLIVAEAPADAFAGAAVKVEIPGIPDGGVAQEE